MAQISVVNYFNTRKRPAIDEAKINLAKKVLVLDGDDQKPSLVDACIKSDAINNNVVKPQINSTNSTMCRKKLTPGRAKKAKPMGNIAQLISNMNKNRPVENNTKDFAGSVEPKKAPSTPTKQLNAMDKVNPAELNVKQLKHKLSRSSRLAELKASLSRFKQSEQQLEVAQQKTEQIKQLKNFTAIELEINLSPSKPQSPLKQYLSPKKDDSVRKNLFALLSPKKTVAQEVLTKESLTLPYKYRCLAEIFRAIDTVCQILHNRKETITFKKLKPAVEEMLKRNFTEKHLAQIMCVYPDSFQLQQEKLREFGTGTRREHWELVLIPAEVMLTSEVLLERRRKFYRILIEKLKDYHQEFLASLDPPMEVSRDKITRWHPQFDIEKVPDLEMSTLPRQPNEEKFTTGAEVFAKARSMFNCNTRMERALEKLQSVEVVKPVEEGSLLKGIPKALLEKVRQRQAAKALESITRSTDKEKELQLYSRLPEIARLARNIFVTERKGVLPIELVLGKLCDSYRAFLSRNEMEVHLKTIAKEVNGWLVFHEIRGETFVKLSKNADASLVSKKLKKLVEQKSAV